MSEAAETPVAPEAAPEEAAPSPPPSEGDFAAAYAKKQMELSGREVAPKEESADPAAEEAEEARESATTASNEPKPARQPDPELAAKRYEESEKRRLQQQVAKLEKRDRELAEFFQGLQQQDWSESQPEPWRPPSAEDFNDPKKTAQSLEQVGRGIESLQQRLDRQEQEEQTRQAMQARAEAWQSAMVGLAEQSKQWSETPEGQGFSERWQKWMGETLESLQERGLDEESAHQMLLQDIQHMSRKAAIYQMSYPEFVDRSMLQYAYGKPKAQPAAVPKSGPTDDEVAAAQKAGKSGSAGSIGANADVQVKDSSGDVGSFVRSGKPPTTGDFERLIHQKIKNGEVRDFKEGLRKVQAEWQTHVAKRAS